MNKITLQFSFSVFFIFLVIACGQNAKNKDTAWQDITPEEGLKGWKVKGGEAEYRLENNTVIGKTVHGTPNTFLTTEKNYHDFILKLEFKVHPSMNSGIQIRSNSIDSYSYMDGRVHGYQVEIDPSDRAWSGGIYDEDNANISTAMVYYSNIAARIGKGFDINENTGRIFDREAMDLWSREYEPGWRPKI